MRSLNRYDHSTDEACTHVRFGVEPDGEYTRYEDTMLAIEELAYAMNEIVNIKRELSRVYDLVSTHNKLNQGAENHVVDCHSLLERFKVVCQFGGYYHLQLQCAAG